MYRRNGGAPAVPRSGRSWRWGGSPGAPGSPSETPREQGRIADPGLAGDPGLAPAQRTADPRAARLTRAELVHLTSADATACTCGPGEPPCLEPGCLGPAPRNVSQGRRPTVRHEGNVAPSPLAGGSPSPSGEGPDAHPTRRRSGVYELRLERCGWVVRTVERGHVSQGHAGNVEIPPPGVPENGPGGAPPILAVPKSGQCSSVPAEFPLKAAPLHAQRNANRPKPGREVDAARSETPQINGNPHTRPVRARCTS
jgi:hypothetical protein